MTIDDFHNGKLPMPKLFRVVSVEFVVLRSGYANGVYEYDTIVTRRVRRVKSKNGWVWQLAIEHKDQRKWDGHLVSDKESLDDVNYGYGLMK